ncbi:hypothetical protein V8E36_002449 [Tilletia maclaganii]
MSMPQFDSVQQTEALVDRLLVFRSDFAITILRIFLVSVALSLFLWISIKEICLYWQKRRWLFRLVSTPEGTIIVPSVNAVFVLFATTYVLLHSILTIRAIGFGMRRKPVPNQSLWILLHFIPLYFAAFWQCWSCAYGRIPGSHRYEINWAPASAGARWPPKVLNLFWISAPCLVSIVVTIPAALAAPHWTASAAARAAWMVNCAHEVQATDQCIALVQKIQESVRRFNYFLATGCLLWLVFCMGLSVLYAIIASKLLLGLRKHLAILLHIKHTQELTGMVRLEQVQMTVVSQANPPPDQRHRLFSSAMQPSRHSRGSSVFAVSSPTTSTFFPTISQAFALSSPHPSTPTTSTFFPTISQAFATHEPLGDGRGFDAVLKLFGIQTGLVLAGSTSFGATAGLVGTYLLYVGIDKLNMSLVYTCAFLYFQVFTVGVAAVLVLIDFNLDRSELFITLMHGSYRAYGLDNAGVAPRTWRQRLSDRFQDGRSHHSPAPVLSPSSEEEGTRSDKRKRASSVSDVENVLSGHAPSPAQFRDPLLGRDSFSRREP